MDKTGRPFSAICMEIDKHFKSNGISYADAAKSLKVSASAVSLQLSGNKRFGRDAAEKWSSVFGFNAEFLLFGTGSLMDTKESSSSSHEAQPANAGYSFSLEHPGHKPLIRNLINIIQTGGNYFALEAFDCLLRGEPQSKIDECISNSAEEARLSKLSDIVLDNLGDTAYDNYLKEYESLHGKVKAKILKSQSDRINEAGGQYSFGDETY